MLLTYALTVRLLQVQQRNLGLATTSATPPPLGESRSTNRSEIENLQRCCPRCCCCREPVGEHVVLEQRLGGGRGVDGGGADAVDAARRAQDALGVVSRRHRGGVDVGADVAAAAGGRHPRPRPPVAAGGADRGAHDGDGAAPLRRRHAASVRGHGAAPSPAAVDAVRVSPPRGHVDGEARRPHRGVDGAHVVGGGDGGVDAGGTHLQPPRTHPHAGAEGHQGAGRGLLHVRHPVGALLRAQPGAGAVRHLRPEPRSRRPRHVARVRQLHGQPHLLHRLQQGVPAGLQESAPLPLPTRHLD